MRWVSVILYEHVSFHMVLLQLMDLGSPALSRMSVAGCPLTAPRCANACSPWSSCDASLYAARCRCHPGYTGQAPISTVYN